MSTDLALIEMPNPLQVFSTPKGLDAVIDKIEAEVNTLHLDISTEKGRADIRSTAYKLAKSKTAIDDMGKELTTAQRAVIDAVNAERKRAWERMEALQAKVRQPLTDWENAEKARTERHEAALEQINQLTLFISGAPEVEEVEARLKAFSELPERDWQEFEARWRDTTDTVLKRLNELLAESKKRKADREELERLRAEQIEREKRDHEERIAAAAAAKAREEAEAEAKAAREKADREKKEAEDRAAAEKARAEKAEAEAKAREADKNHKKKINNEILDALEKHSVSAELGKAIITAIAQGLIPHVKINY